MTTEERWLPYTYPPYTGKYDVSNTGKVRRGGRELKQVSLTAMGYKGVSLSENNVGKRGLVHRMVAQAFIPNPENKPCVNHKDGNPANNHIDNLEWVTYRENEVYTHNVLGKKYYQAKLSQEKADEIRLRKANGEKPSALAKEYGVTTDTIYLVTTGKTWNRDNSKLLRFKDKAI